VPLNRNLVVETLIAMSLIYNGAKMIDIIEQKIKELIKIGENTRKRSRSYNVSSFMYSDQEK
jgi:hypothetical protein